jgi:uncharacterized cupin superfamily protein
MKTILSFDLQSTPAESLRPAPDRILSGNPDQLLRNHYTDPTGQFHAGVWEGEPGCWKVCYDPHEEELCTLVDGQVRITAADGGIHEFGPGQSFVVPGGFIGIWENLTRVRKVYAVTSLRPATTSLPGAV